MTSYDGTTKLEFFFRKRRLEIHFKYKVFLLGVNKRKKRNSGPDGVNDVTHLHLSNCSSSKMLLSVRDVVPYISGLSREKRKKLQGMRSK